MGEEDEPRSGTDGVLDFDFVMVAVLGEVEKVSKMVTGGRMRSCCCTEVALQFVAWVVSRTMGVEGKRAACKCISWSRETG